MGFFKFLAELFSSHDNVSYNSKKTSGTKDSNTIDIHRERITATSNDGSKETCWSSSTYNTNTGETKYTEGWHGTDINPQK